MSLPRGSHSNCGSQPSGWEPFFFTLKQPALVFPHQEISSDSSLLRAPPRPLRLYSARALMRCLSYICRGLAFLYAEEPRGASQYEGNEKIHCGVCNCSPGVGAQSHRRLLISSSEEISAVQHRLLSQPLTLVFSTGGFGFILRPLSKALRGSQKPILCIGSVAGSVADKQTELQLPSPLLQKGITKGPPQMRGSLSIATWWRVSPPADL